MVLLTSMPNELVASRGGLTSVLVVLLAFGLGRELEVVVG